MVLMLNDISSIESASTENAICHVDGCILRNHQCTPLGLGTSGDSPLPHVYLLNRRKLQRAR